MREDVPNTPHAREGTRVWRKRHATNGAPRGITEDKKRQMLFPACVLQNAGGAKKAKTLARGGGSDVYFFQPY